MADDIRQWDFGGDEDERNRQDGSSSDSTSSSNLRRKKKKEEDEKDKEGKPKDSRGSKKDQGKGQAKKDETTGAKKPSAEAKPKPAPTAKAGGAKPSAGGAPQSTKAVSDTARQAAEAARRATEQVAARVGEATARVTAQVTEKVAQVGGKVLQAVVKLLANPYVLAAILLIFLIFLLFQIFTGSVNQINSLAGGSVLTPADYYNPAHRQIVDRLKQKMSGCDPKLVIYEGGMRDLEWQCDESAGRYSSSLDIRILKTLDYLTDRHRIKVDLIKTGAPDIIRDSFLKKKAKYSASGQDEIEPKETLSAFATGQAIAIVEIDRTNIPELQSADTACNASAPAPIAVGWQRTVGEKTIRPIWEELAYSAGWVDKNIYIYQGISEQNDQMAIERLASSYQMSEPIDGAYDLYKETFRKLPRIMELIDRAITYGTGNFEGEQAIDPRALAYLQTAKENYDPLAAIVSGVTAQMPTGEIADRITQLGQPENVAKLRAGARFVYKATQVKNSVNWNKRKKNGDLTWIKADEARNQIRQIIKELLEMPRETSLSGAPTLFDGNLVVKQIITFSPEDDLDNGLENLDIFPMGIVTVDTGGVAIETLTTDTETDNAVGDGKGDYADSHFSHAPLDNGG